MSLKIEKTGNWTIHDIARVAGVSAKTVSRVVNGEAGVGDATRAQIASIIHEVGYHPHMGARSMRSRKRDCIGVALSAPVNEAPLSQSMFVWLFNLLYTQFGTQGNFICFEPNTFPTGGDWEYATGLWQQRYAACVICGPLATNDTVVRRIHESGHPYIVFGRLDSLPECSCATVDYEEGAYLSALHLIQRGHRRIAMLRAFEGYQPGVERRRGYARALECGDLPLEEGLVRSVTFNSGQIADAVHSLLLDPGVTALIDCSAAEDAQAIREGARRAGRVPGRDFEIVDWTYTDNAAVLAEACAHVWLPVYKAAEEGVGIFGEWYDGERDGPVRVVYPPVLYEEVAHGEVSRPMPLFDRFV